MENSHKILITGGLGYIGSHTAVVFGQAGYDLVIVDNLSNSHIGVLDAIAQLIGYKPKFYEADIRNLNSLEKIFEENSDIDGVIHFAAKKAVGESCQDPFLYYDNNIQGTTNLLKVMLNYNIKNMVFSSSATVYDALKLIPPFSENDRLNTNNPYGTTKLMMEYLLKDMSSYKNFNSVILRYFNPIGAHSSGLIGETPKGIPSNLVPFVYKVAKGEIGKLNVWGNDYKTDDGTGVRDYIHVMDVAEAHLASYKHILDYIQFQTMAENQVGLYDIFNIGTGHGQSVKEIIEIAEKITEKKI
ncbi:MAG: UDP-glucose 4-epimerase GalE, partial [Candidatus Absconditicoccaceae bacterium]